MRKWFMTQLCRSGLKNEKKCFHPEAYLLKKLGKSRYSVAQVGSWLFVHGGITSECALKLFPSEY